MSRTDKTDPHKVKVDRYGERYWEPIHHCGCMACRGGWLQQERRKARTEKRDVIRNWRRDFDGA